MAETEATATAASETAAVDKEENKAAAGGGSAEAEVEEAAGGGGGGGDADNADKADKDKEEEVVQIYDQEIANRIIVGRNHPLSFYVDRARRVLRIEEEVHVTGRGDNISTACKLVEALKRQKIAVIERISTGMNVEPYFNSYGDAKWGQPAAVILFKLKRGEFGKFIADYQQRKIIEIFENNDEKSEGILTLEKVESLQFDVKFKANDEQIKEGKEFLGNLDDKNIDLPTFIKYASILIHPLLKNKIFKEILSTEFDIEVSGQQRNRSGGDGGGGAAAAVEQQ